MGRKSRSKKKNRELAEKKSTPKVVPKTSIVKETFHRHRRKIFGGALAMIMILALVWVGFLLFSKAFRPAPVADFLPADRTIAFLSININKEHNQYLNTEKLLKSHPDYLPEKFIEKNFYEKLRPLLGREAGVAYLHPASSGNNVEELYFAEIADRLTLNYQPQKLYNNNGFYQTLLGDYLFLGKDRNAINSLIDFSESENVTLFSSDNYGKVENRLPLSSSAFLYLNFDQVSDSFFKNFSFLSEQGFSADKIAPVMKLFRSEGFSLVSLESDFKLESFLSLDKEKVSDSNYVNFKAKYSANLASYVSADALVFWGGVNLEYQLKRLIEVMSGGDKAAVLIFDNFFENQVRQYLGPNIDMKKDLLNLFSNEFAIAIENKDNKSYYKVLIELSDPKSDALKIQEIANEFAQVGGFFEPKVVEHTLQDGTRTREIVANPEQIVKNELDYNGATIYELRIGQQGWGIYYAIVDDIAIIANHLDGVKNTLSMKESLRGSPYFAYNIDQVLKNSDEISYFNFNSLLPILFKDKTYPKILDIIDVVSSGRQYSVDGIRSIDYLHIK